MQEQNVLFMASLWLYAVIVSPSDAEDLGWAYLVLRSMYPVVWVVELDQTGPYWWWHSWPPVASLIGCGCAVEERFGVGGPTC